MSAAAELTMAGTSGSVANAGIAANTISAAIAVNTTATLRVIFISSPPSLVEQTHQESGQASVDHRANDLVHYRVTRSNKPRTNSHAFATAKTPITAPNSSRTSHLALVVACAASAHRVNREHPDRVRPHHDRGDDQDDEHGADNGELALKAAQQHQRLLKVVTAIKEMKNRPSAIPTGTTNPRSLSNRSTDTGSGVGVTCTTSGVSHVAGSTSKPTSVMRPIAAPPPAARESCTRLPTAIRNGGVKFTATDPACVTKADHHVCTVVVLVASCSRTWTSAAAVGATSK